MSNLVIIIRVSMYDNTDNLSACQSDVENMYQLLLAMGKYEILQIAEELIEEDKTSERWKTEKIHQ